MKMKTLCVLCLCLFLMGNMKVKHQEFFRAQIGIQVRSDDGTEELASFGINRVTAGDEYQIYVMPHFDAYIYVVYSDGTTAKLLDRPVQATVAEQTLPFVVLPSEDSWYQFPGAQKAIKLAIVCSPEKVPKLEQLVDQEMPYGTWIEYEKELTASNIDLSAPVPSLLNMAATARLTFGDLIKRLKVTSSELYVTKLYNFRVKQ